MTGGPAPSDDSVAAANEPPPVEEIVQQGSVVEIAQQGCAEEAAQQGEESWVASVLDVSPPREKEQQASPPREKKARDVVEGGEAPSQPTEHP